MRNATNEAPDSSLTGALIIDKPEGITSHDVVARVRRAIRVRRVGHAGTLDPFATGVLVCCIGPATRLVQFLVGLDKEYIATVALGVATDTQDATGERTSAFRSPASLSMEDVRATLTQFTGSQLQTPPMFSAKKVGGERLYRAARAGRSVKREPANITVHSIELLGDDEGVFTDRADGTRKFRMRVRCSSGTYVRTLANDIGEKLQVGAHLVKLRRTEVGHFSIANALTLDKVESIGRDGLKDAIIGPFEMLSHLPFIVLDDKAIRMVMDGRAIEPAEQASRPNASARITRMCDPRGGLIAVGVFDPVAGIVKPKVVLGAADI